MLPILGSVPTARDKLLLVVLLTKALCTFLHQLVIEHGTKGLRTADSCGAVPTLLMLEQL